jgi:hypothetical protein
VTKSAREGLFAVAYIAVGLLAATIVGWFTHHWRLFHVPLPLFPYLVVGLVGAFVYGAVQMGKYLLAVLMIALLFLIQVALTPPIRPTALAAAAIYALPVGFALLAGAHAQKALARLRIGRFAAMALIVAAGYGLMMLIFLVWSHVEVRIGTIANQAFVGLKLGGAMGLGFELVDLVGPKPRPKSAKPVSAPAVPKP